MSCPCSFSAQACANRAASSGVAKLRFAVLGGEFGGGHGAVGRYPDFAERLLQGFVECGFALFQQPCVFTFRPCGPHMEGEG